MALVSVMVPIYNVAPYLEECIDSIIHQTYRNLQIILVDDGSEDEGGAIVDFYQKKDHRITAIHKKNGGLVSARKCGIQAARGEFVLCVDGDDSILPDFIQDMVEVMEAEQADIVTSGYRDDKGKHFDAIPTGIYQSPEQRRILYANMLATRDFYSFGILPFLWGKMFKREILKKVQMEVDDRISVGEDIACTYFALLQAEKIIITSICGYQYRNREGSMTARDIRIVDESLEHLIFRYQFLKKRFGTVKKDPDALLRQLNEYLYFTLLSKYPELLFSRDGEEYIPYGIRKGERVAIYGTGQFGKKIERLLSKNNFCQICCRTDGNALGRPDIRQSIDLIDGGYDKVIIAVLKKEIAHSIGQWLSVLPIPKEKIAGLRITPEVFNEAAKNLEQIMVGEEIF